MCSSCEPCVALQIITAHVARKFMSELSEVKLRKQLMVKTIERELLVDCWLLMHPFP